MPTSPGGVSVHGEWFNDAALFGRVRLSEALLVVGEGFDLPWLARNPYKVADFGHGELTALDWLLVERISHESVMSSKGRQATSVSPRGGLRLYVYQFGVTCGRSWCVPGGLKERYLLFGAGIAAGDMLEHLGCMNESFEDDDRDRRL